jgi:Tol biopolymer transport system component
MSRSSIVTLGLALFSGSAALAQSTTRVNVDSAGQQANGSSLGFPSWVSLSADGRYAAFQSFATNLVPGDTNAVQDIFVRDFALGTTTRVSVDSSGVQSNGQSEWAAISADGRFVAFSSLGNNLVPGDTNANPDVFVHDMQTGVTERVSVDSAGLQASLGGDAPALSADGRYVAFESSSADLVAGDTNGSEDVFVHDRLTGATACVSVDSAGVQGNGQSEQPALSANGRLVAFASMATGLVAGDTNGREDIFLHDRQTGATERLSLSDGGVQGNLDCRFARISADGNCVAFSSSATTLVNGDTNGLSDMFVHNRLAGTTVRVSVDSSGNESNGASLFQAPVSADGRYVAFQSAASNLVAGDTQLATDIFVHDCLTGTTIRVSVDSAGQESNSNSFFPSISADGRRVAFCSSANDLVPGDTNLLDDIFVNDRGQAAAFNAFCAGDGSGGACPCANNGSAGHGCQNSASTGGALLAASGNASLASDTVQLSSSSELPSALSIVLQGNSAIAAQSFGDGLRCAGGVLKRLYARNASGGALSVPQAGDPSISSRSAALNDPIPVGATRIYQVYYRDPNLGFCPGAFNVTNAMAIVWGS